MLYLWVNYIENRIGNSKWKRLVYFANSPSRLWQAWAEGNGAKDVNIELLLLGCLDNKAKWITKKIPRVRTKLTLHCIAVD